MEKIGTKFDVVMTHYNGLKPVIVEAISELLRAQFKLEKTQTEMTESAEKVAELWKCNMVIDSCLHILKNATMQSGKFAYMLDQAMGEEENIDRPSPDWYKPSL